MGDVEINRMEKERFVLVRIFATIWGSRRQATHTTTIHRAERWKIFGSSEPVNIGIMDIIF